MSFFIIERHGVFEYLPYKQIRLPRQARIHERKKDNFMKKDNKQEGARSGIQTLGDFLDLRFYSPSQIPQDGPLDFVYTKTSK